jgi:hypothetical protein
MSAIDDLKKNVNDLSEIIIKLNEETPPFDISKYLLTPRQMAKKMMIKSATVTTDATGMPIPADEKSIHMIVYGKYMVDGQGKLVDNEIKYPECVDKDKAMQDNHPTLTEKIPKMQKDTKDSIRVLNIKKAELMKAIKLAGQQIATGLAAFAASVVVLPIGSGAPMGLSAIQSIVAAINTLSSRVMEILPILGPLIDIPLMVAEAVIDIVLNVVNALLKILISTLGLIVEIKKLLMPVIKLIGG